MTSSRRTNEPRPLEVEGSTAGASGADDLEEWLRFLGSNCTCEHAWKGLGILYGQSMGEGWVRTITAPDCPEHAE